MTERGYFARLIARARGASDSWTAVRRDDAPALDGDWSDVSVYANAVPADAAPAHTLHARDAVDRVHREPATAVTAPRGGGTVVSRGMQRADDGVQSAEPPPARSRPSDAAAAPERTASQRSPALEGAQDERAALTHAPNGGTAVQPVRRAPDAHAMDARATNRRVTGADDLRQPAASRQPAPLGEGDQPGNGRARLAEPRAVTSEHVFESFARTSGEGKHISVAPSGAAHGSEPRDVTTAWEVRRPLSTPSAASAPPHAVAQPPVTIGEVRVEIVEPRSALVAAPAARAFPAARPERPPPGPSRHAFGLAQL